MGGSLLLLTATESSSAARDLGMPAQAEWTFQKIDHVQLAKPQGGEENSGTGSRSSIRATGDGAGAGAGGRSGAAENATSCSFF